MSIHLTKQTYPCEKRYQTYSSPNASQYISNNGCCVCVSLSLCNKDDDEERPVIEQANLIGKWQSTWQKLMKL